MIRLIRSLCRSRAALRGSPETIYLTFDDGPDPERTPAVLDLLRAHGVPATFFLIGERAAAHPHVVERIAAEGHTIGNHSWSHPWLPLRGRARLADELDRTQEVLARLAGHAPAVARPPYGWSPRRYERLLALRGLTPVLWSIDSYDYLGLPPALCTRLVRRARGGEVVLFHDGNRAARATLATVAALLTAATRAGQRFAAIDPRRWHARAEAS